MEDAHAKEVWEVLEGLGVDERRGLDDKDVLKQRGLHGKNEIPPEKGTPFWKLVLKQFDDLLVKILLGSAAVSVILSFANGETGAAAFVEPSVILLILIANAVVGVVTERNAEQAIEELKAFEAENATVLRKGRLSIVDASDLVPGDIVELSVGCRVPADLRIIELLSSTLRVDQALLTGESISVEKDTRKTREVDVVYQDKTCVLFGGTVVCAGRARAVVIETGSRTAIGKIRNELSEVEENLTPLQKKLDEFGTLLSKIIAGVCILVWIVNIGHFKDPVHGGMVRGAIYYFKIAVALAVAAIPEGLPAVVTTCLALGTKKMAKQNAIVRSLPSVETLGCTTVICSDKTGTLTTNMMNATKLCVVDSSTSPSLKEYDVTGNTFAPEGMIIDSSGVVLDQPADQQAILHIASCASLNNCSTLRYSAEADAYKNIGESTEIALRVLAEKIGLPGFDSMPSALNQLNKSERVNFCTNYWEAQFMKVATLDFTHERKMMSVMCKRKGQEILFTKGAPETVLDRCTDMLANSEGKSLPLTQAMKSQILSKVQHYGEKQALRCLALALKPMPQGKQTLSEGDERDLTFLGIVGMIDPPRSEVHKALMTCKAAGIRVVMITGDNKCTAEAIGSQIGLFDTVDDVVPYGTSFTGKEFDKKSPAERAEIVKEISVFSRVEPSHKSKIVAELKKQGHVVAMTGDGVNDAPALRSADIGVAMGSGTAVARHASDIVLTDDNFSSIVLAVGEGRAIYNNTKQFIRYMVSSNIGEVVCIFIAAALGIPEPLNPIQLLWVNLVTDGLPAVALGFNKPDRDIMQVRPRKVKDAIVDRWLLIRYLIIGLYVGIVTIVGEIWWFMASDTGPKLSWKALTTFDACVEGSQEWSCNVFKDNNASTISMSVLVVVEMFNALNALSENGSLLRLPPWTNMWLISGISVSMLLHAMILYSPGLASIFSVVPLTYSEWKAVIGFSFPVIVMDEVLKFITRNFMMYPGQPNLFNRLVTRIPLLYKLISRNQPEKERSFTV
ncbi:calcium-translocating P-type ATPase [Chloropicon primus]|uniref:Calcium-transporting ATPase n=1 Tax=Chloropicon primus TaxID=1764295 RepID=A0A5B8MBW2_9CHLO|nr:calcium-translocating P-type ATPase [Chloropicon primus]UPQ97143.1 calcium-translocating P-type ATPase [Chloropicon primus]|eukprot:QDZ17928.1 calcium-translocating P-type ATPase [Chloropicon primus]